MKKIINSLPEASMLLKKSFYEMDGKIRKYVYIYLWCTACFPLIALLINKIFIVHSSYSIFVPVFLNIVLIIHILFLRHLPNFLFVGFVLGIPISDILCGINSIYRLIKGPKFIDIVIEDLSVIFVTIIALWIFKYILLLFGHALVHV